MDYGRASCRLLLQCENQTVAGHPCSIYKEPMADGYGLTAERNSLILYSDQRSTFSLNWMAPALLMQKD